MSYPPLFAAFHAYFFPSSFENPDLMFFLYFLAFLYVYFFPSILAVLVGHTNPGGIFFVNLSIGWTIIGWFVLFVWVFDREKEG